MTVEIVTLEGTTRRLELTAVEGLRARMRGSVLTAADAGYDAARRNLERHDRQATRRHCALH